MVVEKMSVWGWVNRGLILALLGIVLAGVPQDTMKSWKSTSSWGDFVLGVELLQVARHESDPVVLLSNCPRWQGWAGLHYCYPQKWADDPVPPTWRMTHERGWRVATEISFLCVFFGVIVIAVVRSLLAVGVGEGRYHLGQVGGAVAEVFAISDERDEEHRELIFNELTTAACRNRSNAIVVEKIPHNGVLGHTMCVTLANPNVAIGGGPSTPGHALAQIDIRDDRVHIFRAPYGPERNCTMREFLNVLPSIRRWIEEYSCNNRNTTTEKVFQLVVA